MFSDEQLIHYSASLLEPDGKTTVPLLATWRRDPERNNYLEITTIEFLQRSLHAAQDKQEKETKRRLDGF